MKYTVKDRALLLHPYSSFRSPSYQAAITWIHSILPQAIDTSLNPVSQPPNRWILLNPTFPTSSSDLLSLPCRLFSHIPPSPLPFRTPDSFDLCVTAKSPYIKHFFNSVTELCWGWITLILILVHFLVNFSCPCAPQSTDLFASSPWKFVRAYTALGICFYSVQFIFHHQLIGRTLVIHGPLYYSHRSALFDLWMCCPRHGLCL